MKRLLASLVVACMLWAVMFSPLTAPYVNFWWTMTGSALALTALVSVFQPGWWCSLRWRASDIVWGVGLATGLWCVFWLCDKVAALLFSFARPQVESIYGMKNGESAWLLSAMLLFVIGPAEEVFWRGYVQRTLSQRWNADVGFLTTVALYALAHTCSCNFMLVMAALTAGVVWGFVYRLFPDRLPVLIVSHSLWDVAVFILFVI